MASESISSSSSSSSSSSAAASSSSSSSSHHGRPLHVKTNSKDDDVDTELDQRLNDIAPDAKSHQNPVPDHGDGCKIFLSRIPQTFNEDSVKRVLEDKLGEGSVLDVSLVYAKSGPEEDGHDADKGKANDKSHEKREHRGFGFVTFSSDTISQEAMRCGTVRGSAKTSSKRRHTLYIQPVLRDDEDKDNNKLSASDSKRTSAEGKDICFLWKKFRCPYGDTCKFVHEGEGGCAADVTNKSTVDCKKSKVQKCFSFKKRGKCKLGDKCPFFHDVSTAKKDAVPKTDNSQSKHVKIDLKDGTLSSGDKQTKDCINWKTKGKCRKGVNCPYRHDEGVRLQALSKKDKVSDAIDPTALSKTKRKRQDKVKQSLSIRVFGLNYSTTEQDVRNFFQHCGKICEITFPTYEDSGRSKGYCGILFASPKAVQKAVQEMNGTELHGRWLSVQEGKMFLRQWEEGERARNEEGRGGRLENKDELPKEQPLGEFGQKVKKRKKHGFSD
ncbi:hypothetical protein ACHAW6_013537 [Cyclotella cf. meneghiniana]